MMILLLSLAVVSLAAAVAHYHNDRDPMKSWILMSAVLGGILALGNLGSAAIGILSGEVGQIGSRHFRTGALEPVTFSTSDHVTSFRLTYTEWTWWGKTKVGSWPVRLSAEEGYEYLQGKTWRPVPIFAVQDDDRSYSIDNRGWTEDR